MLEIVLKRVLCVPTFKFNLMSVSEVTKDLNCCVTFSPKCCVFQDFSSGKVRAISEEENELYTLCSHLNKRDAGTQHCLVATHINDAVLWHQRLCHVPMSVLRKIHAFNNLGNKFILNNYEVCPLARQTRLLLPHNSSKSDCAFQLLTYGCVGFL